jgi:phosphate:Na+ symporter
LVKGVIKIIPEKGQNEVKEPRLYFIDDNMLKTPPVAVGQLKNEIVNMAEIAIDNFCLSCEIVCSLNLSSLERFKNNESTLNFLNENIAAFMVKLLKCPLSERDRIFISTCFRSITDLERVGDYAENIVEYAEKMKVDGGGFSEEAKGEIDQLKILVTALFNKVLKAYKGGDLAALGQALEIEEEIDSLTADMSERHVERLKGGSCTPDVGAHYLNFSVSAERVADHLINVGKSIEKLV